MSGYVIQGPTCASRAEPIDKGTLNLQMTPVQGPVGMVPYGPPLSLRDRIAEAVRRAARYLPGETAAGMSALLTVETLGLISATLAGWAVSHAFGVGEAVDVLLLATGFIFLGREALQAIGHLSAFARLVAQPGAQGDIDSAAWHLAKAITIIGINVAVVLLTHSSIKAYRGRYRPSTTGDPTLPEGEGQTNKYGDITYSTAGPEAEQALVRHHEQVHSFLSPKLMKLREFRANFGVAAYNKSALLRYIEEALAESYAQLRVNGINGLPAGIRFPIANGYVTLRAVAKEAAIGTAIGTVAVGGIRYAVDVVFTGD